VYHTQKNYRAGVRIGQLNARPGICSLFGHLFSKIKVMKIAINWSNEEKKSIYTKFETGWLWDDFWEMNATFEEMTSEVEHPIILIIDLHGAGMPGGFISKLPRIAQVSSQRPKNLDYTVVVGIQGTLEDAVRIFSRVYRHLAREVIFAANLEEAEKLMEKRNQAT
jgi:hypothetical protein